MPPYPYVRVQKTPVFLAGEGPSEQGYGRWLGRLAHTHQMPIAIRCDGLSGGDPLDMIREALLKLEASERSGARYRRKAILLDADSLGKNEERDRTAREIAARARMEIIWQVQSHEHFLLRHFSEYQNRTPTSNIEARRWLMNVWPTYKKGLDADGYGRVLTRDHLARVRAVHEELNAFLDSIGWA